MKKKNFTKREPFYYNGRQYDAQNKDYRADIPFYVKQCKKYGGPVLELACGTGRVTIPIAKAGFDITGIDISPSMLSTARESASHERVKIKFKNADIRNFILKSEFRIIILPFFAIVHLYDLKSITKCLYQVKKHLLSKGKFIFDLFNPDFNILNGNPSKKYPYKKYIDPESGKKVIITSTNSYDSKTQINHIKMFYNIAGKKFVEKNYMRMYFPQELDEILILSGFKINHKYGNFDYSEFTSTSPRQIYICSIKK